MMPAHLKMVKNVTVAKFELVFTRYRQNLKMVGETHCKLLRNLMLMKCQPRFESVEICSAFIIFECSHEAVLKNVPVTVLFSKSTVFKICRQKMCHFHVNRRPIRHIFHHFQNMLALCERNLNHLKFGG